MQCLARCRDEVCNALKLKPEDVELSMGMSGDFEEAVSADQLIRSSTRFCSWRILLCCSSTILLACNGCLLMYRTSLILQLSE